MNGTRYSPSGEGDPSKDWITAIDVEFDRRFTGYSSCDVYDGTYKCLCDAERQPPSTPCTESAVGHVDLKPYYKRDLPTDAPNPMGCSWDDGNICQINLGRKLNAASSNFSWYSTPKKVKGTKWAIKSIVRSVTGYCVIDTIGKALAPQCAAQCKQPLPSKGAYTPCYSSCLFSSLLGSSWNTHAADPKAPVDVGVPRAGVSVGTGVDADKLVQAFTDAVLKSCPTAEQLEQL